MSREKEKVKKEQKNLTHLGSLDLLKILERERETVGK